MRGYQIMGRIEGRLGAKSEDIVCWGCVGERRGEGGEGKEREGEGGSHGMAAKSLVPSEKRGTFRSTDSPDGGGVVACRCGWGGLERSA